MIVLDTHIWIWWVSDNQRLRQAQRQAIADNVANRIGVSVISCWEVAKLVRGGRMQLTIGVSEWLDEALAYPGVELLGFTPEIAVEANNLPGDFHRDPADQILVATARVYQCPLVSSDGSIRSYPHVATVY
jgi:PIN domain nuclease of toxin-antitoxin system